MLHLEPPCPGPQRVKRQGWGLVDPNILLADLAPGIGDPWEILLGEESVPDPLEADIGRGANHALGHLHAAHLKGEERRAVALLGRVLEDIHGQGALAHGGTRRQDDELASLESVAHPVEIDEAAGNSQHSGAAGLVGVLKLVDGLVDEVLGWLEQLVLLGKGGPQVEERGLDIVEELVGVALVLVVCRELDGVVAGLPDPGERPLPSHLVQGAGHIHDSRGGHGDLGEIAHAAHILDPTHVDQVLLDADQVTSLMLMESLKDGLDDDAVTSPAKGIGPDRLDDDGDAICRVLHHAGEDDALVLGRGIRQAVKGIGAHAASSDGVAWMASLIWLTSPS